MSSAHLMKLDFPALSSPTTAMFTSGRPVLGESYKQRAAVSNRRLSQGSALILIMHDEIPGSEHTSSPLCWDRARRDASWPPTADPSSSSTRVWPTLVPDLGLLSDPSLCNWPSGAEAVRLPMPGRCRAAAGIACALSLDARSRRDCWEDMADAKSE